MNGPGYKAKGRRLARIGRTGSGFVGSGRVIRLFGGRFSYRLDKRDFRSALVLIALTILTGLIALASGTLPLSIAEIYGVLLGGGDNTMRMVVIEWRLPRVLLAILLGMALGASGAIFQSLTRNPLGSPDVMGFSTGAYTGALVVLLHLGGGHAKTAFGALVGGFGSAALVYLFAWRSGVEGFRLIVVGIGVSAMFGAANMWMIRQADVQAALGAAFWGAGSLNGLGFEQLLPVILALGVLLPFTWMLSRAMRQLELGEDIARATGVRADRIRLALTGVGVALTAIATAIAGPIVFISLVAPQIASRMTTAAGVPVLASALAGGLLLLAADWAGQHIFGVQLPVGVMTLTIGGIYFLWLLVREKRT